MDEQILRDYFELNGFWVQPLRRHSVTSRKKKTADEIDLLAHNPQPTEATGSTGFQLFAGDLAHLDRALVLMQSWGSSRFTPAMLKSGTQAYNFLKKEQVSFVSSYLESLESADLERIQGHKKILILPSLPGEDPQRTEATDLLRQAGIDGTITFSTILENLLRHVQLNHNYPRSPTLQFLRILKTYGMIRDPQLELFEVKSKK